jgi:hypothetical protein
VRQPTRESAPTVLDRPRLCAATAGQPTALPPGGARRQIRRAGRRTAGRTRRRLQRPTAVLTTSCSGALGAGRGRHSCEGCRVGTQWGTPRRWVLASCRRLGRTHAQKGSEHSAPTRLPCREPLAASVVRRPCSNPREAGSASAGSVSQQAGPRPQRTPGSHWAAAAGGSGRRSRWRPWAAAAGDSGPPA